jgi:hypothetical protein
MIHPRQQWCIQIEVTNACTRNCSNCTRLVGHVRQPYFLPVADFERAVCALKDFPAKSEPDSLGRTDLGKRIGLMGGEPRLHPEFDALCEVMRTHLPREHRGLWTGVPLGNKEAMIRETFGYINHNLHDPPSYHQSALVAIRDVIDDEAERARLIDQCWMQQRWSSAVNPRGFFFCEIAAAMAVTLGGPPGRPVVEGCWRADIGSFQDQIDYYCSRCGFALYDQAQGAMAVAGLPRRRDDEEIDDASLTNLAALAKVASPRLLAGRARLFEPSKEAAAPCDRRQPWHYHEGGDA